MIIMFCCIFCLILSHLSRFSTLSHNLLSYLTALIFMALAAQLAPDRRLLLSYRLARGNRYGLDKRVRYIVCRPWLLYNISSLSFAIDRHTHTAVWALLSDCYPCRPLPPALLCCQFCKSFTLFSLFMILPTSTSTKLRSWWQSSRLSTCRPTARQLLPV